MVSEIKLDDSIPNNQCFIEGITTPYRLDRNGPGSGILVLCSRRYSIKVNNHRLLK